MDVLIDSSVLIAAERGALDLDALLQAHQADEVGISAITASELLHGVHRVSSVVRRVQTHALVEQVLARLPVVAFDLDVARVHAMLSAELRSKGTAIGPHDLLIAATAVHAGAAVATRDLRSFPKIQGLDVLRW
jgi:predicted nucleic acid-binding protein